MGADDRRTGAILTEDRPIGGEERRSLAARIAGLSVPEKEGLAVTGNREVRRTLSQNRSLSAAVRQEANRLLAQRH